LTRVKIAVGLLLGIIAYSVATLFILKDSNEKFTAAVKEIQQLCESEDYDSAYEKSLSLNEEWEKYEHKVTILVNDEHLRELNISVAKIPSLIERRSDSTLSELETIIHELEHILEMEIPTIYNLL